MKTILLILIQIMALQISAQVGISGRITDKKDQPVTGVNVFIQGSYDGSTTDSLGNFSFKTSESGEQMLIASCVGYKTGFWKLTLEKSIGNLMLILEEEVSELDEVVINAGTFEASDKKKAVILRPMDVALTAGANGDVYGAFNMLPGAHKVGEEGRLFVRGGEGYETKTFMDGMLINTPYFSKMPDLPTRGRFSPLLFNGAVFSTGGYSAEYGQALSSIVALNTTALETEDKSSVSVMSVGLQGAHAERWDHTSLAVTGEYLHTGLTNQVFKQNVKWLEEPVIAGSTLMFRHKTSEMGMLKTFGSFSYDTGSLLHDNISETGSQNIALKNSNIYLNTTWNEMLHEDWMISTGLSGNLDSENILLDADQVLTTRKSSQAKVVFSNTSIDNLTTRAGADYLLTEYRQEIIMNGNFMLPFSNNQLSGFVESELILMSEVAIRAGVRAEHHSLMQKTSFMPRLSAAFKTGKSSQLSAAFGQFIQNPQDDYLKFSPDLLPEKSSHSILTWQYKQGNKTLRLEAYHKTYTDLVKFTDEFSPVAGNFNNEGSGYSRGFDLFWRNQQEFGKSDYWISYSWNDSKRNYRDFPVKATPHYVSEHNLSVVYKKFFPKISSFISGTYAFASGRPYYNPNNPEFMEDRTKSYNDVSLGFTHIMYLFNTQSVIHLIVNNALGFNNVFGYQYSQVPGSNGEYAAQPVKPASKRMAVILISFQL